MWFENITKDFGDFTNSIMEDTRNLAEIVSRIAAEVTGKNEYVAGDEDSLIAQECPLDEAAVLAFQGSDSVYLDEMHEGEEKTLFEEWKHRSVYSSVNARQHGRGEGSGDISDDDPVIYRQRLLDNNPLVREKCAALVLTSEEAEQHPAGSGTCETGSSAAATVEMGEEMKEGEAKPTKEKDIIVRHSSPSVKYSNETGEGGSTDKSNHGKSDAIHLHNSQRITEDVFFDRYFFRLSQLRLRKAAELRKIKEEEAAAAATAEAARKLVDPPDVGRVEQTFRSITERIMEVTDELVGWDDVKTAKTNKGEVVNEFQQHRVSNRTEDDWEVQESKINAMESLVELLKREISYERHRVEAILDAARHCGLREDQLQRLEEAASAAGATEEEKRVVVLQEPASVFCALPAPIENKVEAGTSNGGDYTESDEGRDTAVQNPLPATPLPQVETESGLHSARSFPSSAENDGWTNV